MCLSVMVMICPILLSALHALMIPTLMVLLGKALQHFADHYNTAEYCTLIASMMDILTVVQSSIVLLLVMKQFVV